jgi:hypothetical protein
MEGGLVAERPTDYQLWEKSELAAVAGGSYFNPPNDLVTSGREIIVSELASSASMNIIAGDEATYYATELFEVLTSYLHPDESLFGLYRRGTYLVAPLLMNAVDLVTYEVQIQSGGLTRSGYYAVPNQIADRGLAHQSP